MPLVMVSRSEKIGDVLFRKVLGKLPVIVSEALHVSEHPLAHLTPNDIEIRVQESPFDVKHMDVEVTVFATKFELRVQTGQLRSDRLALELQKLLPNGSTGFVWVILVPAFFSTFQ